MSRKARGIIAKTVMFLTAIIISFMCFLSPVYAQDIDLPDYTGYVNDFAGIMDATSRADLEALIKGVESGTGAEIAVVIIDSLEGITIEEYAVELFEKWGIGKADEDNGILILVALLDREVRIEVGYGLEGVITDLEAGRIIKDIIVPNFKNEDYDRGIYDAVVTISNQIYGEEDLATMEEEQDYSQDSGGFFSGLSSGCICCFPVFIIIFIIIFLVNLFKRRCPQCRRFWALTIKTTVLKAATYTSSGEKLVERTCKYCSFHDKKVVKIPKRTKSSGFSSGGGFSGGGSSGGSFGGGSSGGGGASGGW
ncbi:MAG: TPM domain-containing protein [Actinobacteria bacterium]|nr:TPM domain-containing protein [Actinomycetota bacterium]